MKNSKVLNKVNVSVGGEVFSINVRALLAIDENNIEEAGESTVANFGYFSTLKAKLQRAVSDTQLSADVCYSDLFLEKKAEEDSGGRVSDRYAEAYARVDEDYQDYQEQLHKLREHLAIISGIVESLKLKINVIQTISANLRKG